MKKWYQQKTTWAGIAGAMTAIGGYMTGEMEMAAAIQLLVLSVMGVFLRQGVEKVKNGSPPSG